MDVRGTAPDADVGRYFRNNAWWWHPLADFVVQTHPELAAGCEAWHHNSGDGLDAATAIALADALDADLASGKVKDYAETYAAFQAALPRETCKMCRGTGRRTVGVAGDEIECSWCEGNGVSGPDLTFYPFSVDNVEKFAYFLRHCGGFEIG